MGEKEVKSGAAILCLLMEVSLKAAPAASILATEAQAPSPRIVSLREQKGKPAARAMSLIQTNSKQSQEYAKNSVEITQTEFNTELAKCSLGTSELQHPFSMQKLPVYRTSILTGCLTTIDSYEVLIHNVKGICKRNRVKLFVQH